MKFEDALKKLEKIVNKIDNEDISVDQLIKFYEEGNKLAEFCKEYLDKTETKIKLIKNNKINDINLQ